MRSKLALCAVCCLLFAFGSAQWLERQVVIGDTTGGLSPEGGIVVNPVSGNVYIEGAPTQVFNPITAERIRALDATGLIVFCPPIGKGYVVGESLVILDAAADTVTGRTSLPFVPYYVAYSPTSNRLYMGGDIDYGLLVFDPDGDSVLQTIGIGADILSLLWDSVRNRLYVGTNADSGVLKVFDCAADTLLAEVQLGLREVWSFALSTVSNKLYCAGVPDSSGGSGVFVVSADSLTTIGAVPGPGRFEPDTLAYCPLTDRVYGLEQYRGLSVIDCQADTTRAWLEMPELLSLAVSAVSGRAYLGDDDSARVIVLDTNDSAVGTIPLPTAPSLGVPVLTFWPDRNELYGVTYGERAFIIDASADTVTGEVNYADYLPRQMVHNPAGNKLYLFCPGQDEVLVVDSTFGTPKHLLGAAVNTYAMPVLDPILNRIYVADRRALRVIDCNSDSLVGTHDTYNRRPVPMLVPYLNKLYVFDNDVRGGVYAYDCLRDTVAALFGLSVPVYCAVYDPRSNRVFFASEDPPTVRALDPVTDSVVKTFDLVGGSSQGRMALNSDLGRLYYTDQSPSRMFTIDVVGDSVVGSESLPWSIDTMFLNRRLGKLYLCSRGQAKVLVFDCHQGVIVDTVNADFHYSALMDDRNDKLYLRYGAVVDCRYDSVVTRLDSISPRSMAWDAIDNRVFQATTSWLYVYRDDMTGVEERPAGNSGPMLAVLGNPARGAVRLRLQIPAGQQAELSLYDAVGRRIQSAICNLKSEMELDIRSMPAGVYFVCLEVGRKKATDKVVVQR